MCLDAINDENMKNYFDVLEGVYGELDFGDHPERIYNMDETGMPLDLCPPKIIAPKGQKKCATGVQDKSPKLL